MEFVKQHLEDLTAFAKMSQEVGARNDYVQGGGGNTSVKTDGFLAIKASGFKLSDIETNKAYAVMSSGKLKDFYMNTDLSSLGDAEKEGSAFTKTCILEIEGIDKLRPSVEAGFHSILDKFVIHSHSVYANLAACSTDATSVIAAALEGAKYTWGYVPYFDPGVRITFAIRDEIARVTKETGRRPAVIFMQNHGLIVHHADDQECIKIHEDVNERIAAAFGLTSTSFPEIALKEEEGLLVSDTPYVEERLKGVESDEIFVFDALYPDQLVFLKDTFFIANNVPEEDKCHCISETGKIVFNMAKGKAQVILETIAAILFIRENIVKSGRQVETMGAAAKNFIENWESEKYRKSLSGGKK